MMDNPTTSATIVITVKFVTLTNQNTGTIKKKKKEKKKPNYLKGINKSITIFKTCCVFIFRSVSYAHCVYFWSAFDNKNKCHSQNILCFPP